MQYTSSHDIIAKFDIFRSKICNDSQRFAQQTRTLETKDSVNFAVLISVCFAYMIFIAIDLR